MTPNDTDMRRIGHISEGIETVPNFEEGFWRYSHQKHNRTDIRAFEEDLPSRLQSLLTSYISGTWKTSPYRSELKFTGKWRTINKLPASDHVIQWAASLQYEPYLIESLHPLSCNCVPGKGTHFFVNALRNRLFNDPCGNWYFVQLDVHHYFESISHGLIKQKYRRRIKDPKLLRFLDEIIGSLQQGLPLGIKVSQILANYFLADFDRLAMRVFDILADPEKMHHYTARYVSDKLVTCRTSADARELSHGVGYLRERFERLVKEGMSRHYMRFADNIIITHGDKTFLHIFVELCIMVLQRDYLLSVNKNYNVRPVWSGGIDVCGYVFFHDHVMLRKKNKKALCRQVSGLRKAGLQQRDIELKCASRVGFASHGNTINLIKRIGMEKRLGSVISNRKRKAPFEGMTVEQKQSIDEIICHVGENENVKLIQLMDYKVDNSVIEKNDDGTPKQRIAIRYRMIDHVDKDLAGELTYVWRKEERYSFSGSKIMIEQSEHDFSKEDLPIATVVKEFINERKKKFYKFT